mmetsp:Transcript_71858/g.233562  ORF Transcript_71858/g.233562 Transcript_71858/m.233562 type:complete len:246 (-) Transcript_71858:432-1169(-)
MVAILAINDLTLHFQDVLEGATCLVSRPLHPRRWSARRVRVVAVDAQKIAGHCGNVLERRRRARDPLDVDRVDVRGVDLYCNLVDIGYFVHSGEHGDFVGRAPERVEHGNPVWFQEGRDFSFVSGRRKFEACGHHHAAAQGVADEAELEAGLRPGRGHAGDHRVVKDLAGAFLKTAIPRMRLPILAPPRHRMVRITHSVFQTSLPNLCFGHLYIRFICKLRPIKGSDVPALVDPRIRHVDAVMRC